MAPVHSDRDPIVAIATAAGRGAIGIVRVSGRGIEPIARDILGAEAFSRLRPRTALHTPFLDSQGHALDDGILLSFPGPASYTGEDVLEFQGHGGPTVLALVVSRCLEAGRGLGARLALPGEFTRRAFLNDRMDLAQAEAVADLIDAGSAQAARSALRSLQGEFSQACRAIAAEIIELRALVEATLDFPEEEIDFLRAAQARERLEGVRTRLESALHGARQGALLRDGLHVVLVGAPNVGKSSLLNALAREDVALVTEHPGTTRDRIERRIEIDGVGVDLVDTAGLRATRDPVEQLGIERTKDSARRADLVLEVLEDGTRAPALELETGSPRLLVRNKIDVGGSAPGAHDGAIFVSARTGAGLEALRAGILRAAGWEEGSSAETVFLARERHLAALREAGARVEAAIERAGEGAAALDLVAEELRLAAQALGTILAMPAADDLLGEIFGRFCIGK